MNQELTEYIQRHLQWGNLHGEERLRFLVLALAGEVGELANMVKKEWRGDKLQPDWHLKFMEEMADIGNYLAMISAHCGIDLEDLMLKKLKVVEKRKEWRKP